MARHDPYWKSPRRTNGSRGRGHFRGGGRGRPNFRYSYAQRESFANNFPPDPLMNRPPPKPITIIRLEDLTPPSPPPAEPSDPKKSNVVSRWFAKNQHLVPKKKPVIVLDDGESESDDDVVEVPREMVMNSAQTEPAGEHEDSIIFVKEVRLPKKKNMTQVESKILFQEETFFSNPTSSTTISSQIKFTEIKDGFSKDCNDFQRAIRRWNQVTLKEHNPLEPEVLSTTITVCSYNVLCQKTAARTDYLYRHLANSQYYLDWDHRWMGLSAELPTFNADILGLQEVQAEHYEDHFLPLMRNHGYDGVYKRKHGTETKDDGCALFYRTERFERIGYQEVNYYISPEAISNRENIAQILALRCRKTQEMIIVANTHLLFNEERGDVKLAQLAILFAYINKMKTDLIAFKPSVIVMGDFNMEPNSKIYKFVVNGRLFIDGEPVRTMSGQSTRVGGRICKAADLLLHTCVNLDSTLIPPRSISDNPRPVFDGHIRHQFKFKSAYHHGLPRPSPYQKRPVSTYHKDSASPDFIFFETEKSQSGMEKLQVLERFALPTIDTLTAATPWPNKNVPSDHLPIMAKFLLSSENI